MNGRWWSHCMTGIAWSSRSSPEPTPSLLLWVQHSLGLFLWFQAEEEGITTLLCTTQSLRPSPNLPYHSKIRQMGESMTHFILSLGKTGQGTSVPTCEPWDTSHLELFLLFPLGCCCYFIHPLFAYGLTSFPYQPTLSCRSSMLLGSTGFLYTGTQTWVDPTGDARRVLGWKKGPSVF